MNRNDRKIAIAALLVAALALVGIWLADSSDGLPMGSASSGESLDSSRQAFSHPSVPYDVKSRPQPETFPFDPNTAAPSRMESHLPLPSG